MLIGVALLCQEYIQSFVSIYFTKMLEASELHNLSFMTVFLPPTILLFVYSCQDHNLFPALFTVFPSDRKSSDETRGGGVLIAVNSKFCSFKSKYDLQSYEECVWIELTTLSGENLLIGNHYFPPDALPSTIDNYFCILKSKLDSKNCCVVLLGDFNNPGFNWECGLPLSKSRCYIHIHVFSGSYTDY